MKQFEKRTTYFMVSCRTKDGHLVLFDRIGRPFFVQDQRNTLSHLLTPKRMAKVMEDLTRNKAQVFWDTALTHLFKVHPMDEGTLTVKRVDVTTWPIFNDELRSLLKTKPRKNKLTPGG